VPVSPNDTRGRGSKIGQKSFTHYLIGPLVQIRGLSDDFFSLSRPTIIERPKKNLKVMHRQILIVGRSLTHHLHFFSKREKKNSNLKYFFRSFFIAFGITKSPHMQILRIGMRLMDYLSLSPSLPLSMTRPGRHHLCKFFGLHQFKCH
jgi:hypothetical protein